MSPLKDHGGVYVGARLVSVNDEDLTAVKYAEAMKKVDEWEAEERDYVFDNGCVKLELPPGSMGMQLEPGPKKKGAVVTALKALPDGTPSPVQATGRVSVGAKLLAFNGKDVSAMGYKKLMGVLKKGGANSKEVVFENPLDAGG